MSGFCLLRDASASRSSATLHRLGSRALDALAHAHAPIRSVVSGAGWWLGICRGEAEPATAHAADAGGALHVVLSGWIENYDDLLASLVPGSGTRSMHEDVELLLALCERDGPEALARARGPFAAIAWEARTGRLIAMRDHLGELTLCHADRDGLLMIATEEAPVLRHPGVTAEPDFGWLGRFVALLPLPPGRTAFRDVEELAPGELRHWDGRGSKRSRAPVAPAAPPFGATRSSDEPARWREALAFGIPAATRRGRRFAMMLSGGMDSTTTAAFAVPAIRATGRAVHVCAWRFSEFPDGDESAAIGVTAGSLGLDVEWLNGDGLLPLLDPDAWPPCPNTPQLNPFLRLNLACYEAARAAGCDVVLNGHYGDYLYPHRFHALADAIRVGDGARAAREVARGIRRNGWWGWARSADLRWAARLIVDPPPREAVPATLAKPASDRFEPIGTWPPEARQAMHPPQAVALLGTIGAMEAKYERYYALRAGVDRRHPLRHRRIVETALAIPSFEQFSESREKMLTRRAMAGLLPAVVLESGQGGNLNRLFRHGVFGAGVAQTRALLSGRNPLWSEVIRRDVVERALGGGSEPSVDQQNLVLAAAGIELWRRALER